MRAQGRTFTKFSTASILILSCLFFILYYHPLREATLESYPTYDPSRKGFQLASPRIPEKIWYKVGPKGLSDQSEEWLHDCLHKNPAHSAQIMTDLTGDQYVQENFGDRPDIVDAYLSLSVPILKADFLRYLLLFVEGGIWADLDVSCGDVPIREWIPETMRAKARLVVGWEFDVGWGENFIRQFESWTIMAAPGSPHLFMVINDIMEGIRQKTEEYQVPVSGLTLDMTGNVIDFTGPRRLTRGVLKSLELARNETIDMASISNLLEPVLLDDVLILPGYSFAASSNSYNNVNVTGPSLVQHHYAGSWKNHNGGEI
ncbi:hypothetical protein DTO027I6_2338 [Penicillium roqueforti]|uniref:uncharacterized protein n=1 Tax=Penicillium roqueforti TaxID=5082 RepID=UPI001909F2C9|nr:uncharacterized protein LCP9604111_4572 [Penicillium roqueforti]KAF9249416.1 hypothetical protein LCP9604111_4572 [Penicillium roqueforti]KAI3174803.1 hypothetical protein DTO039G3_1961 [Penicillium roqueforti]KAI3217112.1 hypothetical protein DTO027I6_2338 [Penicillium roqueforti]KAI3247346.1 hypothetical protein DTO012A7_264 [Penicillium roqueforti]